MPLPTRWESEASVLPPAIRLSEADVSLLHDSPFLTGASFEVPAVVFTISSSVSRIFACFWIYVDFGARKLRRTNPPR